MEWKKNNKTLQILTAAEKGHYGVVAPIACNIEGILGMVRAAEAKRSPLIIQMFPWAVTLTSGLLEHTAAQAAWSASVPIAIYLDHAQDEALIKQVTDPPFDSIMVDMSHYEMEENLAKVKELVKYCNERHKCTEAEPGRIEGGEDGIVDTADLEGKLTTVEQVESFIETGIDFLAPAFGNVHGEYGAKGPVLEFDRYVLGSSALFLILNSLGMIRHDAIRKAAKGRVCIALLGTNDFPEDIMKRCIKSGVSKVNVNKLILDDYLQHLQKNASRLSLTALTEDGVKEVQKMMEWQMDICGSSGKA